MNIFGMCALAASLMAWTFAWVIGSVDRVWPWLVLSTVLPLIGMVIGRREPQP